MAEDKWSLADVGGGAAELRGEEELVALEDAILLLSLLLLLLLLLLLPLAAEGPGLTTSKWCRNSSAAFHNLAIW